MDGGVLVIPSARKHGLSDDDILHAYRNRVRAWVLDDDRYVIVGGDRAGAHLLEVFYETADDGTDVIYHAMHAHPAIPEEDVTMPRSVEEIIAHADELAAEAEQYEPRDENEITIAELDLRKAAVARATVERQTMEAVAAARREGMSWAAIAKLLGTSRQAAQHRYRNRVA